MQKHRENIRKYISGGVVIFVLVMSLAFFRSGAPAYAQAPLVTPLPGAVATATRAAQDQAQARAQQQAGARMRAEADAARARAAQLDQAGNDAISQGQASYDSAAQDAAQATAAIQAQQLGVASEFVTRAQTNIETGKGQLDQARAAISELSAIVDTQASTIISLTNDNQQLRVSNQNWQKAYTATVDQNKKAQDQSTIGSIFAGLIFVAVFLVLLALIWRVIQNRRDPPPDPPVEPIEGDYTVTVPDEQEEIEG